MIRIRSAMILYFYGVLGMFLLTVPWTPVWDQATLAFLPTSIGGWMNSGWARGAVTGLGALDLCAAAQEAGLVWRRLRSSQASPKQG